MPPRYRNRVIAASGARRRKKPQVIDTASLSFEPVCRSFVYERAGSIRGVPSRTGTWFQTPTIVIPAGHEHPPVMGLLGQQRVSDGQKEFSPCMLRLCRQLRMQGSCWRKGPWGVSRTNRFTHFPKQSEDLCRSKGHRVCGNSSTGGEVPQISGKAGMLEPTSTTKNHQEKKGEQIQGRTMSCQDRMEKRTNSGMLEPQNRGTNSGTDYQSPG
jgi:hypothetical protein